MIKRNVLLALFFIAIFLSSCGLQQNAKVMLLDAKMATGVDDKYMPVGATNTFASGTSKVFLWFSWKDAQKDIKIMANWHYVTDDIPVLDYEFSIPRKEGAGSVSLSMPAGKTLPAGQYRVTLELDKRPLKSVMFKVIEK